MGFLDPHQFQLAKNCLDIKRAFQITLNKLKMAKSQLALAKPKVVRPKVWAIHLT